MESLLHLFKKHSNFLFRLLPLVAFAAPLLILYGLEGPTFEELWKGRAFQLFFIWLIGLELILGAENLKTSKLTWSLRRVQFRLRRFEWSFQLPSARTVAFILSMMLPTLYTVASYAKELGLPFAGLNESIFNWATQSRIMWANSMALSTEYLVFAVMFGLIVFLSFGLKGLKAFSVPAFFLLIVGVIYTVDNVFPYGQFTPFQIFVPTTATLAAALLNIMGYGTYMKYEDVAGQGIMPVLRATDPSTGGSATYSIAWPCAGIESFLIFTVVVLLFLKRMPLSTKSKVGFFVLGAVVTYVINAFRIVEIFRIGISGGNIDMFHFYYGPLPAVIWIVSYPLIILGSLTLWRRFRKPKVQVTEYQLPSHSPV